MECGLSPLTKIALARMKLDLRVEQHGPGTYNSTVMLEDDDVCVLSAEVDDWDDLAIVRLRPLPSGLPLEWDIVGIQRVPSNMLTEEQRQERQRRDDPDLPDFD